MYVRRQILLNAMKLFDLLAISFSFDLANWISCQQIVAVSMGQIFSLRVHIDNVVLYVGLFIIWHHIFLFFSLYRSRRLSRRWRELLDIFKAITSCTLVLSAVAFLFKIEPLNTVFVMSFWLIANVLLIFSRISLRILLFRLRRRGKNLRHMLVVGTNPRILHFIRRFEEKPELGYRLIGFVDEEWAGMDEFRKTGYQLVSDFKTFSHFIANNVVDEVMIGLPLRSKYREAANIVQRCANQGIMVRFLSSIFESRLASSKSDQFEGESIITLSSDIAEGWQVMVKRIMDLVISLSLLLILLPLFVAVAIWIKMTSPGPVFFVQERLGLNKRRFRLYKFRTMVPDAEERLPALEHLNEANGPVFKIKNDPRITSVGKILRITSIDELPQLLNVVKGDMSLVGPRPLPIRDYEGFDHDWHRRRFSVRPGITCLWQVNGRSFVPFETWMELDMKYIDEWSLLLDLRILLKTVPVVLKGTGAA